MSPSSLTLALTSVPYTMQMTAAVVFNTTVTSFKQPQVRQYYSAMPICLLSTQVVIRGHTKTPLKTMSKYLSTAKGSVSV